MRPSIEGTRAFGERARLIPVLPESKKEERATSVLLSILTCVDEFGRGLLTSVGAPIKKRSVIECYTEVCFDADRKGGSKSRPDGLVVIRNSSNVWSALVEAKIGSSDLKEDQVVHYMELAKEYNVDAVITISNQFVTRADHHPVSVPKKLLRHTALLHWSWTYILTEALIKEDAAEIADPDQAYILSELVRFLSDDRTGVQAFSQMPKDWPDVCKELALGRAITRSEGLEHVVASWQQLTGSMALSLSTSIGEAVTVYLPRSHVKDPVARDDHDARLLCEEGRFEDYFTVPNAADRIRVVADGRSKTISASMTVKAPTDKKRGSACVTWLRRQLSKCENTKDVWIEASWPGRTLPTRTTLEQLLESPDDILQDDGTRLPTAFEVTLVNDLAGKFGRSKMFVEAAVELLPDFYELIGQHLEKWQPKPPQIKETAPKAAETEADNSAAY